MFFTTGELRRMGFTERPSYWTPCLILTEEEAAERNRIIGGRIFYYVDENENPIPEGETK